jgi:hypothetical protein
MRSPVDIVKGKVVDYDPVTSEVTIKARYPDWGLMVKREYESCEVRMLDGRQITNRQRKMVYALLREISDYTGQGLSSTKDEMKRKFLNEELGEVDADLFSLADAPVSLVCAFQRYLIHFILDFEIPCKVSLLDYADDIKDYIYACLVHRKCCICGRNADIHHRDRIGMGRDREAVIHEGLEAIPLCREHHTEVHTIGDSQFEDKYHLNGGIPLDRALCKLYGLNTEEENDYA